MPLKCPLIPLDYNNFCPHFLIFSPTVHSVMQNRWADVFPRSCRLCFFRKHPLQYVLSNVSTSARISFRVNRVPPGYNICILLLIIFPCKAWVASLSASLFSFLPTGLYFGWRPSSLIFFSILSSQRLSVSS